jgi:hypothetical protein
MGHPRLGEMMSRQRLCGDVLLAPLMRCRPFVFVKFYRSPVAQGKRGRELGIRVARHASRPASIIYRTISTYCMILATIASYSERDR